VINSASCRSSTSGGSSTANAANSSSSNGPRANSSFRDAINTIASAINITASTAASESLVKAVFITVILIFATISIAIIFIFNKVSINQSNQQYISAFEVASQEEFNQFAAILESYPQAVELLGKAKESAEKIKVDSDNYDLYIEAGLRWKGLGDLLAPTTQKEEAKIFYQKAIKIYEKAIEVSEGKAWIPYLNLGNVSRTIGDYSKAETAYRDAIKLSPGEAMLWIVLADLYRYDLKKSQEEVKDIYKEGLKVVVFNVNLLQEFAGYLRDIGQLADALELYKQLAEKYPDNQALKNQIIELESQLTK